MAARPPGSSPEMTPAGSTASGAVLTGPTSAGGGTAAEREELFALAERLRTSLIDCSFELRQEVLAAGTSAPSVDMADDADPTESPLQPRWLPGRHARAGPGVVAGQLAGR